MKNINERVVEVAKYVEEEFCNDTIAFVKMEDSESMYEYNYTYDLGRLSALFLMAESWEAMSEVDSIRKGLSEKYHKTIERFGR